MLDKFFTSEHTPGSPSPRITFKSKVESQYCKHYEENLGEMGEYQPRVSLLFFAVVLLCPVLAFPNSNIDILILSPPKMWQIIQMLKDPSLEPGFSFIAVDEKAITGCIIEK